MFKMTSAFNIYILKLLKNASYDVTSATKWLLSPFWGLKDYSPIQSNMKGTFERP